MDEKTNTPPAAEKGAGGGAHHGCFFCETATPFFEKVWDDATRNHFRNSRIEFLKGIRSLLDSRIEYLSRKQEPKGTRVTVD